MDVTGAMVTYFLGTEQWPPPDAQEQLYAVAAAALRALREGQDPERPDLLFTLVQMLHGVQDREQDHARRRRRT
jgi:hypothetical protein